MVFLPFPAPEMSSALVHFHERWPADERALIEAAVRTAEAPKAPSPSRGMGTPWVATRQALGSTHLYMASRDQGSSALVDQSAEGLAARIRDYAAQRANGDTSDAAAKPEMLMQLVYESTEARPMSEEDLQSLLRTARAKNDELDVTGLLLYADGRFLQVLEGPKPAVRRLYATIREDPRHTDVDPLLTTTTAERTFPDWRMSLEHLGASSALDGLSSFLHSGMLPAGATPTEDVLDALERFRQNASAE